MTYRPLFHFASQATWINDPNGLFHRDGVWHAYFQNNPLALHWGNMSWGHATSPDLVHWSEHPVAIRFDDDEDVFSGSVVLDGDRVMAVYTSHYRPESPRHGIEAMSLAVSTDGGSTFTKGPGHVLDRGSGNFRDPKVFWWTPPAGGPGHFVLVAVEAEHQMVEIYGSPDLTAWEHLSSFGPTGAIGGAWECPDLVRLPDPETGAEVWALLVSINPGGPAGGSGTQYFLGDFDGASFRVPPQLTSDPPRWLDQGPDHYAAVSFHNAPDGRVIVLGWLSSWLYANSTPTVGDHFRHQLAIPRELSLAVTPDGGRTIAQRLPAEVVGAFDAPVSLDLAAAVPPGLVTVEAQGDFSLELPGLVLRREGAELVLERDPAAHAEVNDAFAGLTRAPLPAGPTSLTLVVDRSSLEVLADDGRLTVTASRYPLDDHPWRLAAPGDVR